MPRPQLRPALVNVRAVTRRAAVAGIFWALYPVIRTIEAWGDWTDLSDD